METKLKPWSFETSDLLMLAWGFLVAFVAVNLSTSFISDFIGKTTLTSLIASSMAQVQSD